MFFRFLPSACDRSKPLQRDKEFLKTPVFPSSLVHSALMDPDNRLNIPLCQGRISAQGIYAPPEPEFRAESWEKEFGRLSFGPKLLILFFQQNWPQKNSPSSDSPLLTYPELDTKNFTSHLCRVIWLTLRKNRMFVRFSVKLGHL